VKNQTERFSGCCRTESVTPALRGFQAHFRRSEPRLSGIADKNKKLQPAGKRLSFSNLTEVNYEAILKADG
jgi:hypothetical protein